MIFITHRLTLAGMFVIMFALYWKLSLIILATFPALFYAIFYLYQRIKASAKRQRKKEGKIASRISEILMTISLVQAFAREAYERERFETDSVQTLEESIRTARMEGVTTRTVEIITAVGMGAVVLFGGLQILKGLMLPGELLIFTLLISSVRQNPKRRCARLS